MSVKRALKKLEGIKVVNMTSPSGNDVPNQFIIYTPYGTIFQSYSTIIAIVTGGTVYLDRDYWAYSTTTGKYRNSFLGETKKETERNIKEGIHKLANLN